MKSYSYNPEELSDYGVSRMRFELGDTTFAPGELTAALCDEEYKAVIAEYTSWKKAKLKCLEAILMRFAHQVNVSVDGLSYSFAERVNFWKSLYDETKKTASKAVPTANPYALNGRFGGDPYFYNDMHENPCKELSEHRRRR